MEQAVRAFVEIKFGANGAYRGGAQQSSWLNSDASAAKIPAPSDAAVQGTIAYCDYIFRRYGRFPAYTAPFRTIIGFQVCHVDVDFYDRFYARDTLPAAVRAFTERALGKS
jgi:hypothetical protein